MAGCGAVGGILLGSATGAVLASALPVGAMESWGWRVPFIPAWSSASRVISQKTSSRARAQQARALSGRRTFARMARCWHGWRDSPPSTPSASICCSSYIVSWLQFGRRHRAGRTLEINTLSMVLLLPVMFAIGRAQRPHRPASRCCWPRRRWLS